MCRLYSFYILIKTKESKYFLIKFHLIIQETLLSTIMNPTVNTNNPIAIIVSKNKLEQDKLFDLLNSFNLSFEEFNILLFLSYLFVIDPITFVSYFN